MYVRLKTWEASAFGDHVLRYRCVHCFHRATARVFAHASSSAQAAWATRTAACPRCHRHDRKAALAVYRATLSICLALVCAPVLLLAWSGHRWSAAVFVGLAIGAVPAMLFWRHKTTQLATTTVRFDPS
jgi:hypothetical protein